MLAAATVALALGACSHPVAPTPGAADLPDVIEALFFGSGPLGQGDCPGNGTWVTYPRDAQVTLLMSSTVDAEGERALQQAIADLEQAIGGRFGFALARGAGAELMPERLQITSSDVADAVIRATCSPGGSGCTRVTIEGSELTSARTMQRLGTSPRLKVHEFGHAVGLCHIDPARVPAAAMAESPGAAAQPRFSTIELDAIRTVYRSALAAGATPEDFRRIGLIR